MRDVLDFPRVLAPDLPQIEQDVEGALFGEFLRVVLEGGGEDRRRDGEGALLGNLSHAALELEQEGRVEVNFRAGPAQLHRFYFIQEIEESAARLPWGSFFSKRNITTLQTLLNQTESHILPTYTLAHTPENKNLIFISILSIYCWWDLIFRADYEHVIESCWFIICSRAERSAGARQCWTAWQQWSGVTSRALSCLTAASDSPRSAPARSSRDQPAPAARRWANASSAPTAPSAPGDCTPTGTSAGNSRPPTSNSKTAWPRRQGQGCTSSRFWRAGKLKLIQRVWGSATAAAEQKQRNVDTAPPAGNDHPTPPTLPPLLPAVLQNNFIKYNPLMKQSSRRSKDVLKSSLDPRKPITDYQEYEQQLASYQQGKGAGITDLFDWSKPSEVIALKSASLRPSPSPPREEPLQNNSVNTEELLRSEGEPRERHEEEYLDDSFEVEPSSPAKPSFVERVQEEYGGEFRNKSCGEIEGELRAMREQIVRMNDRLNRMLDRYELLAQPSQREAVISNPHLFLTREVEINARILSAQAEEMRHIQEKERALEKKDYLVELNELIIEIGKEIHDSGKEKHSRWVDVERIDRLLRELEGVQGTEEEYRQVKDLKLKIVYYFKKLKEQKMQEEELDLEIEKLVLKDNQLSRQFEHYSQIALQNSLEVTTNKKYLHLKKQYQDLLLARQTAAKKKDIAAKFQLVSEEKLEREMQAMRKQLQRVEMQAQELEYRSVTIDGETADFIKKHNVQTREIKSISYRFDDSLLQSDKQKYKPDFRRMSRMEGSKDNNKTLQDPTEKASVRLINDKNLTIDETSSNAEQNHLRDSKLKPVLRQWKGMSEKRRYLESPSGKESVLGKDYKTLESSNIFRPPLMLRPKK